MRCDIVNDIMICIKINIGIMPITVMVDKNLSNRHSTGLSNIQNNCLIGLLFQLNLIVTGEFGKKVVINRDVDRFIITQHRGIDNILFAVFSCSYAVFAQQLNACSMHGVQK